MSSCAPRHMDFTDFCKHLWLVCLLHLCWVLRPHLSSLNPIHNKDCVTLLHFWLVWHDSDQCFDLTLKMSSAAVADSGLFRSRCFPHHLRTE